MSGESTTVWEVGQLEARGGSKGPERRPGTSRRSPTGTLAYLMERCCFNISKVLSMGRASTVFPLPVMVVARNMELYMASSVASITARNRGDIASLVKASTC